MEDKARIQSDIKRGQQTRGQRTHPALRAGGLKARQAEKQTRPGPSAADHVTGDPDNAHRGGCPQLYWNSPALRKDTPGEHSPHLPQAPKKERSWIIIRKGLGFSFFSPSDILKVNYTACISP